MNKNAESIHDKFEKMPMGNLNKVGGKVLSLEKISNISFISKNDKGMVNKKMLGMMNMLLSMNRNKAKWEFIKYSYETSDADQELRNAKEGIIINKN